MAGIDSFSRCPRRPIECPNELAQVKVKASVAPVRVNDFQVLLGRDLGVLHVVARWHETNDLQRRKMLTRIGRLLDREGSVAFDDEAVEILRQEGCDRIGKGPNNAGFDLINLVEQGKRSILKDGIGI